ncbi:MO25-like protein [Populus alba x Populus x berolinensis]|uniref:MO25-like protein n=1 Tax=Populus alba x Populus x berolinensis TaxID=444605 RepID=A0AAD6LIJ6_9ROSI|nr:MO25-like protein [Populus alba x Populus x berolinensis]
MKGLFKSKPTTPVDIVRQTRDLLIYADQSSASLSDSKREEKELLTRHKSTVAEFLSKNYDWFFAEFNSKLLESTNYITRRQAVKLGWHDM